MKRGIRDGMKPAQEGAQVEQLYEAYSGRSETELMEELRGMNAEERARLGALEQELAPMLSDAQRQKLAAIVRSLKS